MLNINPFPVFLFSVINLTHTYFSLSLSLSHSNHVCDHCLSSSDFDRSLKKKKKR